MFCLNGEYFFERNPHSFQALLTYYQTGILVKPAEVDNRIFGADLKFFGFPDEVRTPVTGLQFPNNLK